MNTYFFKKELREQMRKRRTMLTGEEKQRMSGEILRRLISLDEYKKTEILLTYASLSNEVDTFSLIAAALKSGKKVAVPRCVEGKPVIEFYFIYSTDDLECGSYGILEPLPKRERLCMCSNGLCVLPGLSFDRLGARLGYGKGYYDRFLQDFKGNTVGLCFSRTLSEMPLPTGRFDISVNIIVTDKETIRTKGLK
jgi:5-formyltetrahydrofolate cyclo-ligase